MGVILSKLLGFLCHNENHYVIVKIGKIRNPLCTRCTGMIIGFLAILPAIAVYRFDKLPTFIFALACISMFSIDILYWGLTRTRLVADIIWVRVVTGFLLGVGIAIWGQIALSIGIKIIVPLLIIILIIFADRHVGSPR